MRPVHGKILMATGVLHSTVALLIYRAQWLQFFKKGFFNVSPHSSSESSFVVFDDIAAEAGIWFFIGGVLFFVTGQMIHHLEKTSDRLPGFIGWQLLVIGLAFAWMLPNSGFTFLVVPQAIFIQIRCRRRAAVR